MFAKLAEKLPYLDVVCNVYRCSARMGQTNSGWNLKSHKMNVFDTILPLMFITSEYMHMHNVWKQYLIYHHCEDHHRVFTLLNTDIEILTK